MKQLKNKDDIIAQIYSFVKTYSTVFLGIMLFASGEGKDVFEISFLIVTAKASSIAVFRNIYKILTEK